MSFNQRPDYSPISAITPSVGNTFTVDIDDGPIQEVDCSVVANITPSVAGAADGIYKQTLVKLTNSAGADLSFDWTALVGANILGAQPTALAAGLTAMLAIETWDNSAGTSHIYLAYEVLSSVV